MKNLKVTVRPASGGYVARLYSPCGALLASGTVVSRAEARSWAATAEFSPCAHASPGPDCIAQDDQPYTRLAVFGETEGTWLRVADLPKKPCKIGDGYSTFLTRGRCYKGCHVQAARIEGLPGGLTMGDLFSFAASDEVRLFEVRAGAHGGDGAAQEAEPGDHSESPALRERHQIADFVGYQPIGGAQPLAARIRQGAHWDGYRCTRSPACLIGPDHAGRCDPDPEAARVSTGTPGDGGGT